MQTLNFTHEDYLTDATAAANICLGAFEMQEDCWVIRAIGEYHITAINDIWVITTPDLQFSIGCKIAPIGLRRSVDVYLQEARKTQIVGGCSTPDDTVDDSNKVEPNATDISFDQIADLVVQTIVAGQKGNVKIIGGGEDYEIQNHEKRIYLRVGRSGTEFIVEATGDLLDESVEWMSKKDAIKESSYQFVMPNIMRMMVEEFFLLMEEKHIPRSPAVSDITINFTDKDMSLCYEFFEDAVDLMFDAVMDDKERRNKGDPAIISMKKAGEKGNGICCSSIYWEGLTATLWEKHDYYLTYNGKSYKYKDIPFRVIEMLDIIRKDSRICTDEGHHPMCSCECTEH